MAGNSRSGRRPKPVSQHLSGGTYRADRHGPLDVSGDGGIGDPPSLFNADERWMWMHAKQHSPIAAADEPMLMSLCQLWGLYCVNVQAAREDPTNRDLQQVVTGYWAKFDSAASRFGLTPVDRAKLRIQGKPTGGVATRKR